MPSNSAARVVQLHVMHDLGGGSEKWLREFVRADASRVDLVLRSMSRGNAAADALALFASPADEVPIRTWPLLPPIAATVADHAGYREALDEAMREFGVDAVLVSSLLGHSLEVLDTGRPTLLLVHDFFPLSEVVNVYADALQGDPRLEPFEGFVAAERARVRERFVERVAAPNVRIVAPSRSAAETFRRLEPRLAGIGIEVVPHGHLARLAAPDLGPLPADERLRIVIPGRLSVAKGLDLLREALPEITAFADVYLLGCGVVGEYFRYMPHVAVTSDYGEAELAIHVANVRPHLALLPTLVHETFGYTLSEAWMLGIPPVASALGSLAERIEDGRTGFLFKPEARALLAVLRRLDMDREAIARVRTALPSIAWRDAQAMVADYHRLLPIVPRETSVQGSASPDAAAAIHLAATANLAKQVRQLSLQVSLVQDARHQLERHHAAEIARFDAEAQAWQGRLDAVAREVADREAALQELDRHVQAVTAQRDAAAATIAEIHRSTSWRISWPLRAVRRGLRKLGILGSVAVAAIRDPSTVPHKVWHVRSAWRRGGLLEVKKALVTMQQPEPPGDAWLEYEAEFRRTVRPRIVEAVTHMKRRPLISILVPTYNPNQDMLRQMLDSVRAQLYGTWELCIVDDASTDPRVPETLREYARVDRRIKVRVLEENHGVSFASNRALEMATGMVTLLLDHDDLLEDHALFRVAETVIADRPDFLYADEVLVTPDGKSVRRYAFRPAFSLEYLRSHPYIVHPVGFRTELLRELGGFDESLRISQDYDLILRAVEKAERIVHIPEVLYRWRIHGASAGAARQAEVMSVSRGVLQRHLERSGLAGRVDDGPSFNLFDARYERAAGAKVAIVIPTRNHGDLLRQCIGSIRATVQGVPFEIVVIDHESDDPATLDYLRTLAAEGVRVLRYVGPFNFSTINNWAVAQLDTSATHLLFCNNDIEAMPGDWLERMVEACQPPDVGAVGALLYYPDRKLLQHAGVCVGMFGAAEHYAKWLQFPGQPVEHGYGELLRINHEVSAVTAACMLVVRAAFTAVGGFDETLAVGFGDVDLCLRIGATGRRIVMCPRARLVHHESYTRGTSTEDPHPEDSARFRAKWHRLLAAGDPFFSRSLSLRHPTWTLRRPLPAEFELPGRLTVLDRKASRYEWMP